MAAAIQSHTEYIDEHFENLEIREERLEGIQFSDCHFSRCSFAESVFFNCRFVGCTFEECDLSLVQVIASIFSSVAFAQSRLLGIDWTAADWTAARLGEPVRFKNCALNHSTFIGLDLKGISFEGCTAHDVDFREANLEAAGFVGADLMGGLFSSTNLARADFRGAKNYDISPTDNTLAGARFALPEAMSLLYALDIDLSDEELE